MTIDQLNARLLVVTLIGLILTDPDWKALAEAFGLLFVVFGFIVPGLVVIHEVVVQPIARRFK